MRKLATIRKIQEIKAIEGADKICAYRVDGWWVVDTINRYNVGDLAVYCEIDSWIPTELAPFLSKGKEPRVFEDIKGERLRTVKLRGQLSQGLLLPLTLLEQFDLTDSGDTVHPQNLVEGDDLTELLGIIKWERPMNAQLAGMAKGNFPSFIPKTDQERVQNLRKEIESAAEKGLEFEVTEKLEGSSMTCYLHDGVFGVCSRNLDLKETEDNAFWAQARKDDIEAKMRRFGNSGFAIQGELIGPGIQDNIYKLSSTKFYVFDVFDTNSGEYLKPAARRLFIESMGLNHVPVLNEHYALHHTIEDLLTCAEGGSKLGKTEREGIVFKQAAGGMTFKAISNKYLIKSE